MDITEAYNNYIKAKRQYLELKNYIQNGGYTIAEIDLLIVNRNYDVLMKIATQNIKLDDNTIYNHIISELRNTVFIDDLFYNLFNDRYYRINRNKPKLVQILRNLFEYSNQINLNRIDYMQESIINNNYNLVSLLYNKGVLLNKREYITLALTRDFRILKLLLEKNCPIDNNDVDSLLLNLRRNIDIRQDINSPYNTFIINKIISLLTDTNKIILLRRILSDINNIYDINIIEIMRIDGTMLSNYINEHLNIDKVFDTQDINILKYFINKGLDLTLENILNKIYVGFQQIVSIDKLTIFIRYLLSKRLNLDRIKESINNGIRNNRRISLNREHITDVYFRQFLN